MLKAFGVRAAPRHFLLVVASMAMAANSQVFAREPGAGTQRAKPFELEKGSPSLRLDCADVLRCGDAPQVSYAYAPADFDYHGVRHTFFCSGGIPFVSFDSIRYFNSRDSAVRVVRDVREGAEIGTDMAACDPAVVAFRGLFYLFYGSSIALNGRGAERSRWKFTNVIYVARASSAEGPFDTLDIDGTWKRKTGTPKPIARPKVQSVDRSQAQGYLGASWPSAVVVGDKINLWYSDDTARSPNQQTFWRSASEDGVTWSHAVGRDLPRFAHSPDVKFDPATRRYMMFSIYDPHTANPWLGVRSSMDGVNWEEIERLGRMPGYSHNVGIESDERGTLPAGDDIEVSFGAPNGLAGQVSSGQWSLYSLRLRRRDMHH